MKFEEQVREELKRIQAILSRLENMVRNLPVKSNENLGDWLNEEQTQELLGYKTTSLWSLRTTRKIEFSKMGNRTYYKKQSILEYLEKNAKKDKRSPKTK